MQVAVFHPGTQHSWQTAMALRELDRLAWYATSIFYKPDQLPYRLERYLPGTLGRKVHAEFQRFAHPGLDPALVRTAGMAEWIERAAARAGFPSLAKRIDHYGNRHFVSAISQAIRSDEQFALWGYSMSSLKAFELARQHSRTCILDRTTGDLAHYNRLMDEIADRYGDWFLPVERRISDASIANERREYELADRIVVGSPFAARTIRQEVADPAIHAKLDVLNYCYDESFFAGIAPPRPNDRRKPVRFLFLGLAIPRKGIHHVLEAIARMPRSAAELTVVGHVNVPEGTFKRYADRITYRPTVPRADVPGIMAAHDVLVLPSYFEGAGIVLYEALAAGCALIQSDRCAEAVTPETGIMLDRVDTDAVHAAMEYVIDNRDRLDAWRAAAQGEAANYTFARYRENIANLLQRMGL